jgi:hypothetical protein
MAQFSWTTEDWFCFHWLEWIMIGIINSALFVLITPDNEAPLIGNENIYLQNCLSSFTITLYGVLK